MGRARWVGFGLLALAVVALCTALAMLAIDTPNSPQQKAEQAARASYDDCAAKLKVFGLDLGALGDKAEPNETHKREKADLCQQVRMAEAAKETANAAWLQLIASITGLVGLFWTVRLTAKAAKAAADAAEATARSVEVQARIESPFLHVEKIVADWSVPQVIHPFIKNSGNAPAVLLEYTLDCIVGQELLAPVPEYGHVYQMDGEVLEKGKAKAIFGAVSEGDLRAVFEGDEPALLWGYVRYEDVFSRVWTRGFAYRAVDVLAISEDDEAMTDGPYSQNTIMWSRAGGAAYNYDREERQKST